MNKFDETYARIINEMANKQSKKKLVKEQAEGGLYNLKICIQDTYPYEVDIDDDNNEAGRAPEDCSFNELCTRLGGKCTSGPTTVTRNGEYEYVYEFNGISKDQLFELMTTDYDDSGMPLIDQYANNSNFADNAEEFINSANASPDAMVEAVKKLAEDTSDTMYIEFEEC